jgi:hypothetical protein
MATNPGGGGTPLGTVTFYDGTNILGTGSVNATTGLATFTTSTLAMGVTHTLKAVYAASTSATYFAASTSATKSVVVTKASSVTTVTASSTAPFVGQPVVLTATVAPFSPATATPGGSVTFYDGSLSIPLGSGTLSNGVATMTTSSLAQGTHNIFAVYAGSTLFNTSTSLNLPVLVTPQVVKSLAAALSTNSIQVGTPFSISVTAQDANGNTVFGDNDIVSIIILSSPASGGTLTGSLNARFSGGTVTFGGLAATGSGQYKIEIIDRGNGVNTTLTFNTSGRPS